MSREDVATFNVKAHVVTIEKLEPQRWRVSIDGKRYATFCSESRARSAGRTAARQLDFADSHA